jgi:hypothetical protein
MNACLRHKDSSYACWVFKDGAANYEAVQTTQQGGTCFLVFRYSLYLLYWYKRCIYILYIYYIYTPARASSSSGTNFTCFTRTNGTYTYYIYHIYYIYTRHVLPRRQVLTLLALRVQKVQTVTHVLSCLLGVYIIHVSQFATFVPVKQVK